MFTVSEDAPGGRIDVELTRRTGFSRSHVAAAIRAGAAFVNGEPAKPSRILEPGDSVTYTIAPPVVLEVWRKICRSTWFSKTRRCWSSTKPRAW